MQSVSQTCLHVNPAEKTFSRQVPLNIYSNDLTIVSVFSCE